MISNPATFFVNGNDQKKFTYEGGKTLWHFSPHDNGLSSTFERNMVFLADNSIHALDVLRRMCEFAIQCKITYLKNEHKGIHESAFNERAVREKNSFQQYIEAIDKGKVKLTKAPANQFYIVGWASNNTF